MGVKGRGEIRQRFVGLRLINVSNIHVPCTQRRRTHEVLHKIETV